MQNKIIFLFLNPDFDTRAYWGLSKLYQVFCREYGFKLHIIDSEFLQNHTIEEKYSQTLVIAGGDGTLHHVINSIPPIMLDKYVFGIIPGGTANEFAKTFNMPKSIAKAARIIANPKKINYFHLGCLNDRHMFATGFLYGVADYVLRITSPSIKHFIGMFAFGFGSLKLIYKMMKENEHKYKKFKINSEVHHTNYLLINNLSLTSKNLNKDELGHEYNNLLYLVYTKSGLKLYEMLLLVVKNIIHDKILHEGKIHYSQQKQIVLESDEDIEFMLDGEKYKMSTPLVIRHFEHQIAVIEG